MTEASFIATEANSTTSATFTTDKTKTDTPTVYIDADEFSNFVLGRILHIKYRLNPTAAETYSFGIAEAAIADNYEYESRILYESDALRVDDQVYEIHCDIAFKLATEGRFWIFTDWTGAPGNTPGAIRIDGICYI